MDSKYSGFLEANPTFQDRVEAFTSGLLTPDPKPVVLWAMEQGVSYTVGELHQQVKEFVGDRLPISYPAMWSYCRGSGPRRGVLERFGFVANEMDGLASGPFAFARTPAGESFGDAIAARTLWLCGKLTSKYKSTFRIFGGPNRSGTAKTRRGLAVYRVVMLLAEQREQVYPEHRWQRRPAVLHCLLWLHRIPPMRRMATRVSADSWGQASISRVRSRSPPSRGTPVAHLGCKTLSETCSEVSPFCSPPPHSKTPSVAFWGGSGTILYVWCSQCVTASSGFRIPPPPVCYVSTCQ